MPRYYIAFPLSPAADAQLRSWYQHNFNTSLPVQHLHSTIIPPFLLKTGHDQSRLLSVLDRTSFTPITAHFKTPSTFSQKGQTLVYLPLDPVEPFQTYQESLSRSLASYIDLDLDIYDDHKLPSFIPHVTVDYDHPEPVIDIPPPEITFTTPSPQIFTATEV